MMLGSFWGRAFYYLGIPPAKIFIGDIVLFLSFYCVQEHSVTAG